MPKYAPLFFLLLLTGCTQFWGGATPTPAGDEVAIQRFLTSAPAPLRLTATPLPDATTTFLLPRGVPLPLVDPLNVAGNLTISGSPALAPLTRRLYANFVSAGYRDTMRIEEIGADTVFARYCTQAPLDPTTVDLMMSDRPIKQSELALCLEHNRRPIALRVAVGTVVIVGQADADFVTTVSKAELRAIFTAVRWADVRPEWPAVEIIRVVPTNGNVNFALFTDKILGHNTLLLQNAPATTFLDDGREIAFTIADTPAAVGFLDFADYQQNSAGLRLLALDGIQPHGQNVSNGVYPLTYPLLLYTDETTLAAKPQLGAFLLYYLATMNEAMRAVGTFPVNEAIYERTKAVLLTALGQEAYLAQFAPTSTPAPPPTPTVRPTATLTAAVTMPMTVTATAAVTK